MFACSMANPGWNDWFYHELSAVHTAIGNDHCKLEMAMKMMKGLPEPSIAPIYDHYFGDASSHEEKHEKK